VAILQRIHSRLDIYDSFQLWLIIGISIITNLAFLYGSGCYRRDALVGFTDCVPPLAVALGFSAVILFLTMHFALIAIYPNEVFYRSISRCMTVSFLIVGISLGAGVVGRILFFAMIRRHWFRRRVLVIGTGARARYLYNLLNNKAHQGLAHLLFVSESVLGAVPDGGGVPLSSLIHSDEEPIDQLVSKLNVDEVVVAVDEKRGIILGRLLTCKVSGIPISEFNSFIERETGRVDLRWVDLSWLVYSQGFKLHLTDVLLKRFIDITVSGILLLISFPVLVIAMMCILFEGNGPVLFSQARITQGGRVFCLYKLRTMKVDAEQNGAQWAEKSDPRITRVGALLRRFRIDEVPQLVNVLRGDMSLVGPRPERPIFVRKLAEKIQMYDLRHSVKAGLTGWAQINYPYGASVEDASRKFEYDLYYMKNFSLVRDIAILLQTFRILIWSPGVR
jgi:sugar transferase (PEP-CTERM system associated)